MGSSAEKLWEAALKDVQYMVQHSAAAEESETVASSVMAVARAMPMRIMELDKQPHYPHATWKKLISELKLPLKLSTLCKEAQLQHPKSAAVYVSTTLLHTILYRARSEGVLQPGTQLCAATLQQVQQSGLLQHLADMMTDAAEEMAQLTAAAAADEGHDTLQAVLRGAAPAGSSSKPNHFRALSSMYHAALQIHRDHLLFMFVSLGRMYPLSSNQLLGAVPADVFIAALHLANGSLRYVSAALTRIQQRQPGHQQLQPTIWVNEVTAFMARFNPLLMVLASILQVTAGPEGLIKEVPQVQPLLLSPDLLPALAAMVAILALGLAAGRVGSSSNGGDGRSGRHASSSSSRSGACVPAAASPHQLQLELSPAQLQLCDVLGVSGQTLLWAAGICYVSKDKSIRRMQMCSSTYYKTVRFYSERIEELPPQLVLQMVKLDLLLPSFVLRWLDSIPTNDPQWAMQCSFGCSFNLSGFKVACLRMLQYQELGGAPMQHGQQQQATPAQVLQQLLLQQPVPVELIAEVLPVVLRLCTAILQQLQQASYPSTGGASQTEHGDTASSSKQAGEASSSRAGAGLGGSSGQPATQPMSPAQQHACDCHTALVCWADMLPGLLIGCALVRRGVIAGSGNAFACDVEFCHLHLFTQHAANLLTVLEGTLRVETPTGTSPPIGALCFGELQGKPAALLIVAREAGPGSQAQLHMYSLLCTMLKISGSGAVGMKEAGCNLSRLAAAEAAVMLLVAPTREAMTAFQVGGASAVSEGSLRNTGWGEGPAIAAALQDIQSRVVAAAQAAAAAAAALDVLPCLVILGRCLLQWAQQLQAEVPFLVQQSAEGLQTYFGQAGAENRASSVCICRQCPSETVGLVMLVQSWLQARSHSAELAAAGYAPQPLLHQLDQLLAAIRGAQSSNSSSETPSAAAYTAVVEQLQSTGLALCALAVPCMCNYPGCTNLSGLTELGTVSGRSCMCGGCRVAHYCSMACQKKHWKQHKPVCTALAGAVMSSGAPV